MLEKHLVLRLVVITIGIYFFSFFNQFVWDDEQFIYNNQYVRNFSVVEIFTTNTVAGAGELSNYYRPLTTLSFALDYQFWGLNPFGYHLVNTFLHIATGLLIYVLLIKLKFTKNLSFISALIFLIHPLQTEAVTYINSRGDSLYSFFLLLSLVIHSYIFEKKAPVIHIYQYRLQLNKASLLFLTTLTFLLSILSKEIALAGLGLHALLILRHVLLTPPPLKKFWGLFNWPIYTFFSNLVIVCIYLGLRATALNFQNTFNFFDDTSIYSESLLVRLLTFFKIIFIYIKLIFVPYPLHMERTTDIITTPLNGWLFAFVILCTVLAVITWQQWSKLKDTTIFFGWAWTAIMLVPVSGIIAINGLLYEHWLYLPIVGVCIVTYELLRIFVPNVLNLQLTKYLFICIVSVLCLLTLRQNYFWSTPVRLYTHLLKYTDSARIHNNLAMAYSEQGDYQKAVEHYQKSLEYGIPYPQIYHNMANTYVALGDTVQAEASYKKALEISPDFFHSYPNLINLYIHNKDYQSAIKIAQQAQTLFPESPEYHLMELEIYRSANDTEHFEEKKAMLLQTYSSNLQLTAYIKTLRLPQE